MKRLLLAAWLLATPALAQAPPAIPALPDTPRFTQYTINTGSTCACAVNFAIYGDGNDVDNWIQIFWNGTRYFSTDPVHGWTLTSITGPIASIPRPITNAIITFNNAAGTDGNVVQIIGARRPRRLVQFNENQSVAARDLNQVLTDIIAQNRETWDEIIRGGGGGGGGSGVSSIVNNDGTLIISPSVGSSVASLNTAHANTWTANQVFPNAPFVNVVDYGADPSGVADSTVAIQNVINNLPVSGGTVWFPAGTYKISSTITIGNGTSSAASTRSGVRLIGGGALTISLWTGFPSPGSVVIDWEGAAHGTIFNIAGPLHGWGVENMVMGSLTNVNFDIGLQVTSAGFGRVDNLAVVGAGVAGIMSTTFDPFSGVGNADSIQNTYKNILVSVPTTAFAKGIMLRGGLNVAGSPTSDTDYNTFENIYVSLATTANTTYGIYLQACDIISFNQVHLFGTGAGAIGFVVDYSINGAFAAPILLSNFDNPVTTQYLVTGSPTGAITGTLLVGIPRNNGGRPPSPSGGGNVFAYLENYSLRVIPTTVAGLSALNPMQGTRAFVTDATATTFASIVTGGGANPVPVYYDGTNWRIGG